MMKHIQGIISLDTFQLRQETIIQQIKPRDMPHMKIFGIRQADDPRCYIQRNKKIIEENEQSLIDFLTKYPQSVIISNYYFGILPETREFIQQQQDDIAKILVITCQDDFYTHYVEPNNYPISPRDIVAYSDDHGWRKDDLLDALHRR